MHWRNSSLSLLGFFVCLFLNTQINPLLQGNKNRFQTTISQKSDPVYTRVLKIFSRIETNFSDVWHTYEIYCAEEVSFYSWPQSINTIDRSWQLIIYSQSPIGLNGVMCKNQYRTDITYYWIYRLSSLLVQCGIVILRITWEEAHFSLFLEHYFTVLSLSLCIVSEFTKTHFSMCPRRSTKMITS